MSASYTPARKPLSLCRCAGWARRAALVFALAGCAMPPARPAQGGPSVSPAGIEEPRADPAVLTLDEAARLLRVTEEGLYDGIEQAQAGNRLGDISAAVQRHVEAAGYSVVRDFVGHGIGRNLHEEPQIPNYGVKGRGIELKPGMVLAIEPMVNEGTYKVRVLEDDWTVTTEDGKLSAHFEHSVVIMENGPLILSRMY